MKRLVSVESVLACVLISVVAGCDSCGTYENAPLGDKADAHSGATKAYEKLVLPPAGDTYTVIGQVKGLKNYVIRYDNGIYRGGEPTGPEAAEALQGWGVKTILSNCPDDDERALAKKIGAKLVELPYTKDKPIPAEMLDALYATYTAGQGPFYAHCVGGTHRASLMVLFRRLHLEGWDYDKAASEHGILGGDLKADHIMLQSIREYRPKQK
jgi:protein tyrosine phosphatase (PTP) superfamily phosphohydrolase (DUF442 family)